MDFFTTEVLTLKWLTTFPSRPEARRKMGAVRCRERLGGVLKYYEREAA